MQGLFVGELMSLRKSCRAHIVGTERECQYVPCRCSSSSSAVFTVQAVAAVDLEVRPCFLHAAPASGRLPSGGSVWTSVFRQKPLGDIGPQAGTMDLSAPASAVAFLH
ncbi:hypothetical protein EYF80_030005 [Liparis tanakae]|uniref:Uncharacterized protein n=1 Tax=Liparis tanakae TaxID=230148 RepID=A0A4Z2H2X8_9TELE|nr:hypothetical protein EYF80_030005 [Liparis tanakae]